MFSCSNTPDLSSAHYSRSRLRCESGRKTLRDSVAEVYISVLEPQLPGSGVLGAEQNTTDVQEVSEESVSFGIQQNKSFIFSVQGEKQNTEEEVSKISR